MFRDHEINIRGLSSHYQSRRKGADRKEGDELMNTILKVNGLTRKYGSKTALNNVTFSVEKGRIYGFIGENGAGKTTAIRAITGLSEVPEGSNFSVQATKRAS